jgi:hypothetical protein
MFGVCGNELSADGHIVDFQYGCGAHSDTPRSAGSGSPAYDPYDDGVLDLTEKPAEDSADKPAEDSVEDSADEPVEDSVEDSADEPVEDSVEDS